MEVEVITADPAPDPAPSTSDDRAPPPDDTATKEEEEEGSRDQDQSYASTEPEPEKEWERRLRFVQTILSGRVTVSLHQEFLIRNNHTDLQILKNTKVAERGFDVLCPLYPLPCYSSSSFSLSLIFPHFHFL